MGRTRALLCWLPVVVCFAIAAKADTINVTFTATGGTVQGNVYVAPYYLKVNGAGDPAMGLAPGTISVACDDYAHDVNFGDTWNAQVSTYSDLSQARFYDGALGTPQSAGAGDRLYQEAGWLLMQMQSNPSQDANLNFAMWGLFDPAITGPSPAPGYTTSSVDSAAWWANQAAAYAPTNNSYYSSIRVLTPIAPTTPQEYLTITTAPVPEPTSLALMGAGLLAAGFRRLRMRR